MQHYTANVKYILHLAKQILLFINSTGHTYPERSGEHPPPVPSGHGSRYRERESRKGSRPEDAGRNVYRETTGDERAGKQHREDDTEPDVTEKRGTERRMTHDEGVSAPPTPPRHTVSGKEITGPSTARGAGAPPPRNPVCRAGRTYSAYRPPRPAGRTD